MELRRLKYFIRVAELGSLTKASVALRVAQPALSRQMHLLQTEMGITLFRRVVRGMELTEAGEHLFAAITGPMQDLEQAIKDACTFAARLEGDLAIAIPSHLAETAAPAFVGYMSQEHPNIKLRIVEGPTGMLFDWLNRGLVDFALLEDNMRDERHGHSTLLSAQLMLVGGPDTDLRPDRPVAFEQAARLPLILSSHVFGIRGVIDEAAAKANVKLNIQLAAEPVRLAKELVAGGLGYSIMPAAYFRSEQRNGALKFCPIDRPELLFTVSLAWRKNSKSGQSFADVLQETFRKAIAGDGK